MNLDLGNCQKDVKGEACCFHIRPPAQLRHKAGTSVGFGLWLSSVSWRFIELAPSDTGRGGQ